MSKTLRLSLAIGFGDDASDNTIKEAKADFKKCLKESLFDIVNEYNEIVSFNIIDEGIKEGDA